MPETPIAPAPVPVPAPVPPAVDAFEPAAGSAYEKVVRTLVAHGGDALQILEVKEERSLFLLLRSLGPVEIAVVHYSPEFPARTAAELRTVIKAPRQTPVDVVLVGGDLAARDLLRRARPFYTRTRVGLLHFADDGSTWSSSVTALGKLLFPFPEKSAAPATAAVTWEHLRQRTRQSHQHLAAQNAELHAFAQAARRQRPVATWSLAAVIGVVYALELFFGGSETTPVLVRLGALVPSRLAQGEWWRLISCTFLHAGGWHVLLNTYVLVILGTFLERIVGPARFIVLYAVSAVCGSIGSALFLTAELSVGASGGVWGLLVAHALLAFRPQGLLPAALIPGARKAALINLGINVLNSFRPFVDMWAHFAGGAGGGLVFLSGVLTRGLPKLGEAGAAAPTSAGAQRTPLAVWAAAIVAVVLLLSGPVSALVLGDPFALRRPLVLDAVSLKPLGVTVALPPKLVATTVSASELHFGEVLFDPLSVSVSAYPLPALDAAAVTRELESLQKSVQVPEGSTLATPPALFAHGAARGLSVDYAYPSGLIYERAFLFLEGVLVRVDALRWPEFPAAAPKGAARRIVETAAPLPR